MISFHGNTACTVTLGATVTAGVRGTGISRLSASGHFPSLCHSNSTISEEFMRVSLCFVTVKDDFPLSAGSWGSFRAPKCPPVLFWRGHGNRRIIWRSFRAFVYRPFLHTEAYNPERSARVCRRLSFIPVTGEPHWHSVHIPHSLDCPVSTAQDWSVHPTVQKANPDQTWMLCPSFSRPLQVLVFLPQDRHLIFE